MLVIADSEPRQSFFTCRRHASPCDITVVVQRRLEVLTSNDAQRLGLTQRAVRTIVTGGHSSTSSGVSLEFMRLLTFLRTAHQVDTALPTSNFSSLHNRN